MLRHLPIPWKFAGDYEDLTGCRVVILRRGRTEAWRNPAAPAAAKRSGISEIVPAILNRAPDTVLVVATNPVDVMTHGGTAGGRMRRSAWAGTGFRTTLDTARFARPALTAVDSTTFTPT